MQRGNLISEVAMLAEEIKFVSMSSTDILSRNRQPTDNHWLFTEYKSNRNASGKEGEALDEDMSANGDLYEMEGMDNS